MTKPNLIIVALDYDNADQVLKVSSQLNPDNCIMKLGKSLFTRDGQRALHKLADLNHKVFLALKFHDIPATVAGALKSAADYDVWIVNVHASGGKEMLNTASEALTNVRHKPLLIAVTVLTNINEKTLKALGVTRSLTEQVNYLTKITMKSGLDCVACSAQEAANVKNIHPNAITVTPGIRPLWTGKNVQERLMTPINAIQSESDYFSNWQPHYQSQRSSTSARFNLRRH